MEKIHNSVQESNFTSTAPNTHITNTGNNTSKEKHQASFQSGCKWVGVGAIILGLSFGITYALFQTDKSFITIMYVMTSLGAMCVMKGLVDVFGF